jgi:agmatinase
LTPVAPSSLARPAGESALVLHPDLVPVPADRCVVDLAGGGRIPLPGVADDLVRSFVHPADPRRVLAVLSVGRGPDQLARVRTALAGLIDRGFVVGAPSRIPAPYTGLFDAPRVTVAQALAMERPGFVVIGMPYDLGVSGRPGARGAPAAIRRESTELLTYDAVGRRGWFDPVLGRRVLDGVGLADVGDLGSPVADRNGASFDRLERTTFAVAAAGLVPVVLGGDHSIALPAIRGVAAAAHRPAGGGAPIGVLHLDAHADIGIDHGPDADWRTVCHHGNVMTWVAAEPAVASLVQVGCRQRSPVEVPVPADVTRLAGIVAPRAVLDALDPDLSWYVTLDVDVLDPAFVGGTGTPLPGGYDPATLAELLAAVAAERSIIGVDVCELIPDRPSEAMLAADLLVRLLGS